MMILFMKMAFYIIASVLFGLVIGLLYSNAKNREIYDDKEQKMLKIISEKNSNIIKLKSELRSIRRKIDAINQGYTLQSKLLTAKESELKDIKSATKEYEDMKTKISRRIKTNLEQKQSRINSEKV